MAGSTVAPKASGSLSPVPPFVDTKGAILCNFNRTTGQVIALDRRADVRVQSSGGGGYLHPQHGGFVAPPRVSSVSTPVLEFFLRSTDGVEHAIKLRGMELPLRTGHFLSLVTMKRPGGSARYALLINHDLERWWILSGDWKKRLGLLGGTGAVVMSVLLALYVCAAVAKTMSLSDRSTGSLGILLLLTVFVALINRSTRKIALNNAWRRHLEGIARESLRNSVS